MSVRSRVLVLLVVALSGCGPENLPATASPSAIPMPETTPAAEELAIAEALATFARTGEPDALDPSAFAEEVALGLGQEIVAFRTFEELSEPTGWRLDRDVFRASVGPFSVLDQLRGDGDVVVSIGPHPHCAAPPTDPPEGLAGHRRVSIQPASVGSCLQWWTVDLFLGAGGRVEAITMDLYEP